MSRDRRDALRARVALTHGKMGTIGMIVAAPLTGIQAVTAGPSRVARQAPWWVLGVLVILLLIGHDTVAATITHGSGARRASTATRATFGTQTAVAHDLRTAASHIPEPEHPPPASQACLTSQSGVLPLRTPSTELQPLALVTDVRVARLEPQQVTVPPIPTLSPAARRALLQVYLN